LELLAIRRALERLAELPRSVHMAINASPATLLTPGFYDLIASISAQRIVVEITEHAPVEDYDALTASLSELRARGGRVSIDDTGAGFASLSHILRLSPNFIKLDRSLTSGIEDDRSLQALAAGLISFSDTIGATIIAEGIERDEQVAALLALGVPCGQGYLIARPAPLSEQLIAGSCWLDG
jgi:EAL domain-containing protein (putative c-di-GMP-specific phosphodiesterase class I)